MCVCVWHVQAERLRIEAERGPPPPHVVDEEEVKRGNEMGYLDSGKN